MVPGSSPASLGNRAAPTSALEADVKQLERWRPAGQPLLATADRAIVSARLNGALSPSGTIDSLLCDFRLCWLTASGD